MPTRRIDSIYAAVFGPPALCCAGYDEGNGKRDKPKAMAFEIEQVTDINGDGSTGVEDVKLFLERNPHTRKPLAQGGDFRTPESVELLKKADIVVTNPPFSLFREYIAQLVKYEKKFLIIGNTNSITYAEVFLLIKQNRLWLGCTNFNVGMFFQVPDDWQHFHHIDNETGRKIARVSTSCWFTNLEHGRQHQELPLMTQAENLKFNKKLLGTPAYERYENYDAIEVPFVDAIPRDYEGVMGVPITFLDKYNPDQFEIVGGSTDGYSAAALGVTPLGPEYIGNVGRTKLGIASTKRAVYKRILIRHRHK